jgi:hypothetical protein
VVGGKDKVYIITESELTMIAEIASKEAISAYKREQEKYNCQQLEKCRNSAKMLIVHYKRLKRMKDTSVYDSSTVTDMTLAQIFNSMLGRIRMNEFELTSTNRNRIITGMLMNHVDVQLDNYKKECDKSNEQDFKRRYRIVEMMYLLEESISAEKVADIECIDKSSVYRTLERAYDDLAVLFFGIDGAKMVEWKKMELKAKRELTKRKN